MVASKQLRLVVETEEERRARLENDAATKWLAQVGHGRICTKLLIIPYSIVCIILIKSIIINKFNYSYYVCIYINGVHIYLLCIIKFRIRWCSSILWRML